MILGVLVWPFGWIMGLLVEMQNIVVGGAGLMSKTIGFL